MCVGRARYIHLDMIFSYMYHIMFGEVAVCDWLALACLKTVAGQRTTTALILNTLIPKFTSIIFIKTFHIFNHGQCRPINQIGGHIDDQFVRIFPKNEIQLEDISRYIPRLQLKKRPF